MERKYWGCCLRQGRSEQFEITDHHLKKRIDNKHGFGYLYTGLLILLLPITAMCQQGYPRVTGYASITHPIATLDGNGTKMNFSDSYTVIFPIGLNLMKSGRFGFSFEVSPAIKADNNGAKVSSILFHPGAVFRFDGGFGMAGRLAFDTNGRFGFTTVFNKVLLKKEGHNYWVAVPFPVRFGNSQPTSVGMGLQFGVGF